MSKWIKMAHREKIHLQNSHYLLIEVTGLNGLIKSASGMDTSIGRSVGQLETLLRRHLTRPNGAIQQCHDKLHKTVSNNNDHV